jgi:hypothetical protein
MGFINQFNRNINQRVKTDITKNFGVNIASSSIQNMGGAFVLLDAKLLQNPPVRLRLYTDENSMIVDANRAPGNFNLSQSVGLIADINLTTTETLTFTPPVIGHAVSGGLVWYNMSGSGLQQTVELTSFTLSEIGDSEENKEVIIFSGSQVPLTAGSFYGVSGSFQTPKSFAILKAKSTYNFNPDQQWAEGNSNTGGSGWEFYYDRQLTGELHTIDSNVTKQFPEIPVDSTLYASKIATRTGTFWQNSTFYLLPVDAGETYRVSGWHWCTNTTQNPVSGCGYILLPTDSGGVPIYPYLYATSSGASGEWEYASHEFTINTAATASIIIGTFIDSTYPNGYGLSPECPGAYFQDPLTCPGYGWFTGFTVENVTDFASRLRIYSTDMTDVPLEEQTRSFGTQPNSGSKLIADMMFDSASFNYPLVPVLEAYTWEEPNYIPGVNRTSYILENLSSVTTVYSGSLNTSLTIYTLED